MPLGPAPRTGTSLSPLTLGPWVSPGPRATMALPAHRPEVAPCLEEQSWVSRDHGVGEGGALQLIWASRVCCLCSEILCSGKTSLRSQSTGSTWVFVQVTCAHGRGFSPLLCVHRLREIGHQLWGQRVEPTGSPSSGPPDPQKSRWLAGGSWLWRRSCGSRGGPEPPRSLTLPLL